MSKHNPNPSPVVKLWRTRGTVFIFRVMRRNAVLLAYTTAVAGRGGPWRGFGSLECFVIVKCTKFGQLIFRKIIKIVATRCHMHQIVCRLGSTPDPACRGSLQRSPRPSSWIL